MKQSTMNKIILIHQNKIQHYRVSVYNYLSNYLKNNNYDLTVISEGVQEKNPYTILFTLFSIRLTFRNLVSYFRSEKPLAVVYFINPSNWYLYPLIVYMKIKGIKVIYWGHGVDLQNMDSGIKIILNKWLHKVSDAIILYAEDLKRNIKTSHHQKIFIANNTLNFEGIEFPRDFNRKLFLEKAGIETARNIVFSGRVQKRKRIEDLLEAFNLINFQNTGLIIIGPLDLEYEYIANFNTKNVHYIGPCYGLKALQFLRASDVFCIPGAIGLSIVDAQYCGLPVVTENVQHGPEIMYLKENINGFIVNKGDVHALAEKLTLLLTNDGLRMQFSESAIYEAANNAHIKRMCEGFCSAFNFIRASNTANR